MVEARMRVAGEGPGVRVRGAALLMALVVAAIATLIVSGLFWRQFVLVRTIENQQLMSQSRLLLRGALASQASMSGAIEDAQSRLNLRNLVGVDGALDDAQRAVLARLASELSLPQPTADLISAYAVQAFGPVASVQSASAQPGSPATPLPLVFPEDIARIPGLDPSVAPRLAPYVVVLDGRTPVNFNTASAELIAAEMEGLSLANARALVADRDRIPFVNTGDSRLQRRDASFRAGDVSVISNYFFIRGQIKLLRADTRMEALVKRAAPGQPGKGDVLWEREL